MDSFTEPSKKPISYHLHIAGFILLAAIVVVAFGGCGGGGGGEAIPTTPQSIHGKTYGGTGDDYAWSIQQTVDGGYIFAGSTTSAGAGGYDAWVVKTDANGNVIREKTFGTSGNDFAFSVQQTTDGGYIVAGVNNVLSAILSPAGYYVPGDFAGKLSLRKLDGNLDLTWETEVGAVSNGPSFYPLSMGYEVQQTTDGRYIVAGATGTDPAGGSQSLLLKTDASGVVLWNVFLEGELATGVRQAGVSGYVVSTGGAGGVWNNLIKTDPDGALLWDSTLTGSTHAVCNSLDGVFAVTGLSDDNSGNVFVAKTDAGGTPLWEWTFGSTGGDVGYSIQQVSHDEYIVVGTGSGNVANHSFDVYLIKMNDAGNLLWERYFGGIGVDVGRSVRQTSDGGYILAGFTTSAGAGGVDAYLVKTDATGGPEW